MIRLYCQRDEPRACFPTPPLMIADVLPLPPPRDGYGAPPLLMIFAC